MLELWNVAILGFDHVGKPFQERAQEICEAIEICLVEQFQMYAKHVTICTRGLPFGESVAVPLLKSRVKRICVYAPVKWSKSTFTATDGISGLYWKQYFQKHEDPRDWFEVADEWNDYPMLAHCHVAIEKQCRYFIFLSRTNSPSNYDRKWVDQLLIHPFNIVYVYNICRRKLICIQHLTSYKVFHVCKK